MKTPEEIAKAKKAKMEAVDKWQKENVQRYNFRVNKAKFPEVVKKLESVASVQGYLIDLIMKDLSSDNEQ